MTMYIRQDVLLDQNNAPIVGAQIYVYVQDGLTNSTLATLTSDGTTPLANPVISDAFGNFKYYANTGFYIEDIWFGGKRVWKNANEVVGTPGTPISATLVNFTQSGTGAVQRTVQAKLGDTLSLKDFGAQENGTTDDSTAFFNATAIGPVFGPLGNLKTSSLPATFSCFSFGGTFSGSTPVDGPYPTFGAGVFRAITRGTINCLVGIAHNNSAANTNAEPCGVTGYGRVDNGGNAAFGLFGRSDLYATTGVSTNEVNSFNYGAAPSSNLPPNRAIGTTQCLPIAWTVAAGGNFNSAIGIHICQEGSAPQSFLTGIYGAVESLVNYFLALGNSSGTLKFWVKPDGSVLASNITLTPTTVASLPTAGTVGRRSFVTDATATTFASTVVGGGSNKVPVYDNGTNWCIG